MLGAGLNRAIRNRDGLSPPLINDFFEVALNMKEYGVNYNDKSLQPLYDYIQKFWGKDKHSLASTPFDIEECFTLLELQSLHEEREKNRPRAIELRKIQSMAMSLFQQTISTFRRNLLESSIMSSFGKLLYRQKPCILTFNYDCYVETIVESASGLRLDHPKDYSHSGRVPSNSLSDDLITYSFHKWNRPRGYGFKFDWVELHHPGVSEIIEKKRFYSHPKNSLYSWPILKLHGSLNWFRCVASIYNSEEHLAFLNKKEKLVKNQIVVMKGEWESDLPQIMEGWILTPTIITPIIYKDNLIQSIPGYKCIFDTIWTKARKALSNCRKLIVIGYSFPPTDFPTKRLLLESFSEHSLEELIVVNPDTSVCSRIKKLCHFNKPVTLCTNLDEFLSVSRECA